VPVMEIVPNKALSPSPSLSLSLSRPRPPGPFFGARPLQQVTTFDNRFFQKSGCNLHQRAVVTCTTNKCAGFNMVARCINLNLTRC
jgi:hypothetical protein